MIELNYKKLGESGPELLMLHGWKQSIDSLHPLGKLLSKNFQVYIVDLPGFGKTPFIPKNNTTAHYVQYVKDFIEDKKIKPSLIGHSFGGKISVKLASLYPDILDEKLILFGTPGLPRKKSLKQVLRLAFIKSTGRIFKFIDSLFKTKLFENKIAANFGSRDYKEAAELRNLLVNTVNEDLSIFASKIKLDTLILSGKLDEESPISQAKGYNSLIENSKLTIMPHHDHFPFSDVGSHLCYKLVNNFLNNNDN